MTRRRRPLYHRVLRLRHIHPKPLATFILFEGSVLTAGLLALAELTDAWALLVVPVTVGVMVKLNDVVTGVLRRPVAIAQLNQARLTGGVALGRSPQPRSPRPTTWIEQDDAVIDPRARPDSAIARGIASVPRPDPDGSGPAPEPRSDGATHRRRDRGNQGRFVS